MTGAYVGLWRYCYSVEKTDLDQLAEHEYARSLMRERTARDRDRVNLAPTDEQELRAMVDVKCIGECKFTTCVDSLPENDYGCL